MRRVICIVLLITGLTGVLFGAGVVETRNVVLNVTKSANTKNRSFSVISTPHFGKIKVQIIPENEDIQMYAWAVRIGTQIGDYTGWIYFSSNDFKNEDEIKNAFKKITKTDTQEYTVEFEKKFYGIQSAIKYYKGKKDYPGIAGSKSQDTCIFYIDELGREKYIDFLIIDNKVNKDNCEFLQIQIIPEFFAGETDFFLKYNSNIDYPYEIKCLALIDDLMGNILDNPGADNLSGDFKKIKKHFGYEKATLPGITYSTEYTNKKVLSQLLRSLYSHISYTYEKDVEYKNGEDTIKLNTPYIDVNAEDIFSRIYVNRNPYLFVYLQYLFEKEKPPLSFLIEKRLKEVNFKVNSNYIYKCLSKSKGHYDDIALSALKYLTWGVEYTPYFYYTNPEEKKDEDNKTQFDLILQGYSFNRVFKDGNVGPWIINRSSNADKRKQNYRREENPLLLDDFIKIPDVQQQPTQIQIFEDDFHTHRIKLVGRLESKASHMNISKIDYWTSRNIVWDENTVCTTFYDRGFLAGDVPGLAEKKYIISDKEIKLDVNQSKFHIPRNGDAPIKVGYIFYTEQKISALLLVRGWADSPQKDKVPDEPVKIGYWLSHNESEENKFYIPQNKFIEFVLEPQKNRLFWTKTKDFDLYDFYNKKGLKTPKDSKFWDNFPDVKNKQFVVDVWDNKWEVPGFGVWTDKFSLNNNAVTYSYFIFAEPIENCTKICIEDHTGNEFLNIAELMVFKEDPINFKNYDQYGNKKFASIGVRNGWKWYDTYWDGGINRDENFILINGNHMQYLNLGGTTAYNDIISNYIVIDFKSKEEIKTVAVWEPYATVTQKSLYYKEDLLVISGCSVIDNLITIYHTDNIQKVMPKLHITTPFTSGPGNPIPYTCKGIDSPRIFNYKMYEQWEARRWYREKYKDVIEVQEYFPTKTYLDPSTFTTIAEDSSGYIDYGNSYVTEELFKEKELDYVEKGKKPFLPGFIAYKSGKGYIDDPVSFAHVDKIAGVDSMGLLAGSLSMSELIEGDKPVNIVNLININVPEQLDAYYKMADKNAPGLDRNDGKPVFFVDIENNTLAPEAFYRFTKGDLERSTLLIPDISLIQPGDLLVNNNIQGEPHIGIVVATLWDTKPEFGVAAKDYWDKVLVVSTRKGFGMTCLGVWGTCGGVFGGFSDSPEDYSIRRLVKTTITTKDTYDVWVPDDVLKSLAVDIVPDTKKLQNESFWHWIPNTGEAGTPFSVYIEGIEIHDRKVSIDNRRIQIISPRDQYFTRKDLTKDTKSNLYQNKGTGLLFCARKDNEDIPVAEFTRQNGDKTTEDTHYSVTYEKPEYAFITRNDKLYWIETNSNGKIINESDIFVMKAYGTMRPGDDFLLRFALEDIGEITGVVCPGDFVAVYDKEVIWLANLYIDESYLQLRDGTIKGSGLIDWNDRHPWDSDKNIWSIPHVIDAADFEANIEGKEVEGMKADDFYTKKEALEIYLLKNYKIVDTDLKNYKWVLETVPDEEKVGIIKTILKGIGYNFPYGKQIPINAWTPAITPRTTDRVYVAVAYTSGNDDVISFNIKQEEQRVLINTYYKEHKEEYKELTKEEITETWKWDSTQAPGDTWYGYVGYQYLQIYYDFEKEMVRCKYIGPENMKPVIPQLNVKLGWGDGDVWRYNYTETGFEKVKLGAAWGEKESRYYQSGVNCMKFYGNVAAKGGYIPFYDTDVVVPGDMVYLYDGKSNHAAVVNEVIFENNTRKVRVENIYFIESGRGYRDEWRVINKYTWVKYDPDFDMTAKRRKD